MRRARTWTPAFRRFGDSAFQPCGRLPAAGMLLVFAAERMPVQITAPARQRDEERSRWTRRSETSFSPTRQGDARVYGSDAHRTGFLQELTSNFIDSGPVYDIRTPHLVPRYVPYGDSCPNPLASLPGGFLRLESSQPRVTVADMAVLRVECVNGTDARREPCDDAQIPFLLGDGLQRLSA